ncbi:MAG TPA: hypothetical protein VF461_08210 [Gemmatimonadaceae bacterium]
MRRAIIAGTVVMLLAGCRTTPQVPVQLQGEPSAIARLAGAWVGEYWNGAGGRGGSLGFSLRNGSDSLYGDVTMLDPHGQQLRAADPMEAHRLHVQSPTRLRIDLVIAQGDSVHGVLEPYISPDCECAVSTTFFGRVSGNRIDGRFETRSAGRVRAEGKWELERKRGGQ